MRSFVIPPVVSIVIPVFNEEAVLPELFKRLTAVFDQDSDITWRALLVNDGSVDRTTELVRDRTCLDQRFALLDLTRNFGFQAALAAGLIHATGDAVITMDADLQDPPEVIPKLIECWLAGADIVHAVRRSRQETEYVV